VIKVGYSAIMIESYFISPEKGEKGELFHEATGLMEHLLTNEDCRIYFVPHPTIEGGVVPIEGFYLYYKDEPW
jgi:hypothetical protein